MANNEQGKKICGSALRKKPGKFCQIALGLGPNGRCRLHGGFTPSGIASATYKDGRYSKAMPPALAERFQQAARDPDLLSLVRLVAILDARLVQTLEDLGKPGASWDRVIAANKNMIIARRRDDMVALRAALTELSTAIDAGDAELQRWQEIKETIEGVRKLIDSIKRHQVQSQQIVTLMQMQTLFNGLAKLVRKAFVGLMAQLREERERKAAQRALTDISNGFQALASASAPLAGEMVH